ncbi:MAG: hypothetical protein ACR2O2_07830 [Ruegeria sp.]
MSRMLFPALILSSPALAHTDAHAHVHGSDYVALFAGLALFALVAVMYLLKPSK